MKHIKLISIFVLLHALCLDSEAVLKQYSNIPTVYLTTKDNVEIQSKEVYVQGTISIATQEEAHQINDMEMQIRLRGNSTAWMDKHPYRIKLSKKTRLLGLPAKEKDWVLLANYADKTLLRNAAAFTIGNFMSFPFSPSIEFVDVVLNNTYIGNYLLTDQIEVGEDRVLIQEQPIGFVNEEILSGGYLLEIDGFAGGESVWFETSKSIKITIKYPDDKDINLSQQTYIKNHINAFEAKLMNHQSDTQKRYRSLVDSLTLVDWYIASEFTGNSDAFWSTYIYKYRNDDKIYFGPLWDYDIAFDNDNRIGNASTKLMRDVAHPYRLWIETFAKDPWFIQAVKNRWSHLRYMGIQEHVLDELKTLSEKINASQKLNFAKWDILNRRVYLEPIVRGSYQAEYNYLVKYINNRVSFLDSKLGYIPNFNNLTNTKTTPTVSLYPNPANEYIYISGVEKDQSISLQLYSAHGLISTTLSPSNGRVSIAHIPAGIYIVRIICNGVVVSHQKLMIE